MKRLSTQRKKRLLELIENMPKSGLTIRDIAKIMGIDRQLVQYYKKSYPQDNLQGEAK